MKSHPLSTSFFDKLTQDPRHNNISHDGIGAHYSSVTPRLPSDPELLLVTMDLALNLGMETTEVDFLSVLSGQVIQPLTTPYAMNYGGHQFGNWAGQLGDGRVINLFSIDTPDGVLQVQLKGSGETPYSRGGDGLAVLRSSVREYLMSEAMFSLGIPTTRALALIKTGDYVMRDRFYNGVSQEEPGAIVVRVAPTFIRFGSLEILAAQCDIQNLERLIDAVIDHYYTDIDSTRADRYIRWFEKIVEQALTTLIHWQRVGFVHGVLNTDNISINGLTIDYGPFGFMERYDQSWTPNSSDPAGRYCYGNQPQIMLWNLRRLGNTVAFLDQEFIISDILAKFQAQYENHYLNMMRQKLGLYIQRIDDKSIIDKLLELFEISKTDMTIFFRLLSKIQKTNIKASIDIMRVAFYDSVTVSSTVDETWNLWFESYNHRLQEEKMTDIERALLMNQVNPKYILRNWMLERAIAGAEKGDYSLLKEFQEMIRFPYAESPQYEIWFTKNPDFTDNSMLSCSS